MAGQDDWIDDVRRWCFEGGCAAAAPGRDESAARGGAATAEAEFARNVGMAPRSRPLSPDDATDPRDHRVGSEFSPGPA